MARAGMTELLALLRGMSAAGTADYAVAGVDYWSDAQLQAVLDRNRQDWELVMLQARPTQTNGTAYYYDYVIPPAYGEYWEREASGETYWRVTDSTGATQGTALYSVDWDGRVITFAADQAGSARYLSGRTYNLNRAAAQVWRQKASYYAGDVDWSTDGHRVNASQAYDHCIMMAETFEVESGMGSVQMVRGDANR